MPLRADARALLEEFTRQGARPYDELGVLRARRGIENAVDLQGPRVDVGVRDLLVPGPAGLLPVRVYDPGGAVDALMFFHGGGWVLGSVALADRPCRALAAATGRVVVSVEYRRAPETPFPGPLEDCWAATRWVAEHPGELGVLGGGTARVAVSGDSAGGNLAAGVALLARERGPLLDHQVLLYPCLDPAEAPYPSRSEHAEGLGLTRGEIDWYWSLYLAGAAPSPSSAPLHATDLAELAGLPPTLMVSAEFDPLRDEDHAYAERLVAAGVPTTVACFDGTLHGFLWFGGRLEQTAALIELVGRSLAGRVT